MTRAVPVALREERGFTLVELLTVMLTSIVVISALLTMIDVTLHQTTRIYTRVDATQRARTQMEELMNELHAACLGGGVTPIQAGSTPTSLIFFSAYDSSPSPTPVEHQVTFDAARKTLIDTTYSVSGGSSPNWTFSSTPSSTTTLLTNVSQSGSVPVFQYFAYQQVPNGSGGYYADAGGEPYMLLVDGMTTVPGTTTRPTANPLSTPLSQSDALQTAEVLTTLKVGPSGGSGENPNLSDANETTADSAVLRLTPAANHVGPGTSFNPCQ